MITIFSGFFLQSFSLIFILPVGGMIIGILCGSGVFYGLRLSNIKVEFKHYILSIFLAIVGFAGTYIVLYLVALSKSGGLLTVSEFVNNFVINRTSTFRVGGMISRPFRMGATYNWIKLIIEAIGFIIGGFVVGIFILGNKRYCDKCKKYMKDKRLYYVRADNPERIFNELKEALTTDGIINNYLAKCEKESKVEKRSARSDRLPYFDIGISFCQCCMDGFIVIRVMKRSGTTYNEEQKLRQLIRIESKIVERIVNRLKQKESSTPPSVAT
jgi:large-conductance mechanosensitive channel